MVFGQTGKVYITARETEGGKLIGSSCRIYNEDKSDWWGLSARKKNPQGNTRQLPTGKYTVNCSYNEFKQENIPLEIKAGETSHVDVVFTPFFISAKCVDPGQKVFYEIYGSDGAVVYDKKAACAKELKIVLDKGDYTVEGTTKDGKVTVKISVGSATKKAILDFSNLNHEEEIKADSSEAAVVSVQPKKIQTAKQKESKTVTIGGKKIQIEGINEKDAADLKKAAAMLQMLGGMMQGNNAAVDKEKKTKQSSQNEKADKEFDEMSKDLDMFTK